MAGTRHTEVLWGASLRDWLPPTVLGPGQSRVEFVGQGDEREAIAKRRFEISLPEALYENEREEQREHEIDDCRRFVLENVVQAPVR